MPEPIGQEAAEMLRRGDVLSYVGTTNPDGSPHVTPTWVDVDTDRGLVLINSAEGRTKVRNLRRDPRVMIAAHRPERPTPPLLIRGTVTAFVHQGVLEHMDGLSRRYDGVPWEVVPGQRRVILEITPERIDFPD
jgi:PPOX class probable F420-dependent enzyme